MCVNTVRFLILKYARLRGLDEQEKNKSESVSFHKLQRCAVIDCISYVSVFVQLGTYRLDETNRRPRNVVDVEC